MIKIPTRYHVGGQVVDVFHVYDANNKGGEAVLGAGYMNIADTFNGYPQTDSSKANTFLHELTHTILDTMGREDLSDDEMFVSSFSSFLCEAMNSFEYGEEARHD